jgi:hypothetical protein
MKWLWIALPVVCLCLAVPCQAQNRSDSKATIGVSPGELAPTQEMWFYEQYQKQYTDPKAAVRQQAEFRSVERLRRIAALRWFGFSNQRPSANVDPIHSDYAPHWASNNVNLPDRWNGPATATILVRPSAPAARGY